MAQRVHISLTDDLLNDDTPADETVTFGLDGTNYEIDLSADNAAKLREALAPYRAVARPAATGSRKASGSGRRGDTRARATSRGASANDIREWARAQGMEVSDRGRVRDEVRAAYEAAHR